MMPRRWAVSRFAALRPKPTTSPINPAARAASANEPPISPTPAIVTRSKSGGTGDSFAPDALQRGDKALVFLGGANGDPHVFGKAVHAHRADDHTLAQQRLVDALAAADPHEQEVCPAGHVLRPEARQLGAQVRHAVAVAAPGALDVLVVVERGQHC